MKALTEMNVTELTAEYNTRSGKTVKKVKGSKAAIIAKIEALDPAPAKEARKVKRGASTKLVLRDIFKSKKVAFTMDELIAKMPTVKPNTIETAIVDLKNPKWARGPVLKIMRGEDNKFRIGQ